MNNATAGMFQHALLKSALVIRAELDQKLQERREREGIPASNEKVYLENMEALARRQAEIDEEYRLGKRL